MQYGEYEYQTQTAKSVFHPGAYRIRMVNNEPISTRYYIVEVYKKNWLGQMKWKNLFYSYPAEPTLFYKLDEAKGWLDRYIKGETHSIVEERKEDE